MRSPKYWVIVASRDHALRAVEGGFCQACHGRRFPMERMSKGDGIVIYSSRAVFEGSKKYQKFTAIGHIKDDEIYQVEMLPGFAPFRRKATFLPCAEIPIKPLLSALSVTMNKPPKSVPRGGTWGMIFRLGFLEITQQDFELIRKGMVGD